MRLTEVAPPGWDDGLAFPVLSSAFARAARTMGLRALYATDGLGRALVLLRSLPGPLVRCWTTRAKIYVDAPHPDFVPAVVATLRSRGISYARLGDSMWGLPPAAGTCDGMVPVTTHLMAFDATVGEAKALAQMTSKTRRQLRHALREGVVVEEVHTEAELEAFCALVAETRARMRARDIAAAIPESFYRAMFRELVPRGGAVLLLARTGASPLAAALFLVSPERMSYYHGGSTRDRALTSLQGPTALFWHAMRLAHTRGIPRFDLGAVTPTDDPAHPHHSIYRFKRGFGGCVEPLRGAEIQLSPLKCRFQDRVVLPAWKLMYPWYLALVGHRSVTVPAD